ncbi:MAG: hypothetical protein ACF8TS_02355 [Maioricimonas sp. JB049]
MSRYMLLLTFVLLAATVAGPGTTQLALSDDASGPKPTHAKTEDAAREKAALAFAAEHHPELATLIRQLRRMNPDAYQKAIQELSRTSERLSRFRERAPDRHDVELHLWKLDSRIRLLAAQSAMSVAEDRREQIRQLLIERADVRLEQLRLERERVMTRLQRLDRSIDELQSRRPELVEKELNTLLKSARSRAAEKQTPAKRKNSEKAPQAGTTDRSSKPATTEAAGQRGSDRNKP